VNLLPPKKILDTLRCLGNEARLPSCNTVFLCTKVDPGPGSGDTETQPCTFPGWAGVGNPFHPGSTKRWHWEALRRSPQHVGRMGSSLLFATKTKLYPCYCLQNCIFGAVLKKILASQAQDKEVIVWAHHPETSPAVSDGLHSVPSVAGIAYPQLQAPAICTLGIRIGPYFVVVVVSLLFLCLIVIAVAAIVGCRCCCCCCCFTIHG
jgi:hypothetical protein